MAAWLRVLHAGIGATIQDGGRYGYLRYGVTPAGPMDWTAFRTTNLALGNVFHAAAIEVSIGGLEVICEGAPIWLAFAGGDFVWHRDGKSLPKAARLCLAPGASLTAGAGHSGTFAYLAVEGGIATPVTLVSRATHTRSGIGGVDGRTLRSGDVLPVASTGAQCGENFEAAMDAPWLERQGGPLRVVLGPQDDYFTEESLSVFFSNEFALTAMADRMAYYFDGPEIISAKGYDIVSDGIALGAIQIPGDKRPLVLMADRQPTGGYPKLGVVARADIGRLAQMRPKDMCRFKMVSAEEARAALLQLEEEITETVSRLRPLHQLTSKNLLEANLIDGVFDPFRLERTQDNF
ncbi:MAG TPA: biotin-dependent carboxyltransferase family protein [Methylocella sp.]|nr:biotin-dependent carboxyltransferase family protein [Methylocella sp.]